MAPNKGIADRMFAALRDLEKREGQRVTDADLGERVAKAAGRRKPYAGSVAARWRKGEQVPRDLKLWHAIASALGTDPGYLAFGTSVPVSLGLPPAEGLVPLARGDLPAGAEREGKPARKRASGRRG